MTPVAEQKLALYREEHRIRPVKDFDDDIRRGFVWRCDFDHIRIHPTRGDRWRHDIAEIRALARGEVAW